MTLTLRMLWSWMMQRRPLTSRANLEMIQHHLKKQMTIKVEASPMKVYSETYNTTLRKSQKSSLKKP